MTTEESRNFLIILHKNLWPEGHKNGVVSLEASRRMSEEERLFLEQTLKSSNYFYEFFSSDMFGGYGMRVYEHAYEPFPGAKVDPKHLITLIDGHLFDKFEEESRQAGSGSSRAWEFFSQFTHTPENIKFCNIYKYPHPCTRSHYDY